MIYGKIAKGEIEATRIGRTVSIPARVARRLLGMEDAA
jgi:hypothetical protein